MHLRRDSTARTRQLGDELRAKRQAAELRGTELAARLNWSPAKIHKLESGERGTSDVDVALFLTHCGVTGAELDRLLTLNRETGRAAWLQLEGAEQVRRTRTLAAEEARATTITAYHCLLIPGLLQSRAYVEHIGNGPPDSRLRRQDVLYRPDRPDASFFIDEQVLRRPIGGSQIMHDQLMHLLFVPAEVRIVPVGHQTNGGIEFGNFVLLDDADGRSVVYLESKVANVFLEEPGHVALYRETAHELSEIALDAGQSRAFLTRLADEYGVPHDRADLAQEQP
ncbi:helix-turn-helix domain-containing protein [Umezawaea beigongshangensis]|uniref:helix-turn-helix domain-containing protein n=1 Tax=Umezawaea beigongshangensis TaxID=2780383 RepID=UPI0018F1889D|nr:helix-turn-helix transcriptional regulator [Umezawaea beigongshangensis]